MTGLQRVIVVPIVYVNYIITDLLLTHISDDKSPLHIITNPFTTNIKRDVVLGFV